MIECLLLLAFPERCAFHLKCRAQFNFLEILFVMWQKSCIFAAKFAALLKE